MEYIIGFILGLLVGAGLVYMLIARRRKDAEDATQAAVQQMRDTFTALAAEALDANSKRLTESAGQQVEAKKALIDQSIKTLNDRLNEMGKYIQEVEKGRKEEFGRLGESVNRFADTSARLQKILAGTQTRGQWGERMAEDILRLAGMEEGVNYAKQSTAAAEGQSRPDFTFFMPNDLKVNMDAKFPLEHYRDYLDAETDEARAAAAGKLTTAVKGHIREVASRGYIDQKSGTVDYVLLFVPSEPIYALSLSADPGLIDEALARRIVLTSPMTLFAMLAVIRQAAESANLMQTAHEVIALLGTFDKQWQKYREEVDRLGNQLGTVQKTYENLAGTRTNMLQRPLDKIQSLRQQRALPEAEATDE